MSIPKFYNINDLLRQAPDGARIVPVSKPTLYRMIAAGTFPSPRKLGKRSVWIEEDITLWLEQFMEKETELDKVIETTTDHISTLKGSDNGWFTNDEALELYPRDLIDAVQEAVISMACLMDDYTTIKIGNEKEKYLISEADLDHINEQLLIIEDRLKIGRNTLPMENE